MAKSDVSDEFGTDWSEAEIGGELSPHGTSCKGQEGASWDQEESKVKNSSSFFDL